VRVVLSFGALLCSGAILASIYRSMGIREDAWKHALQNTWDGWVDFFLSICNRSKMGMHTVHVLSGTVNLLDHVFLDFVRLNIHLVSMQRNPTHTHQQEGNNLIDRVLHMSILGGQNALYLQNPHVHIRQSLNRVLDILFGTHTVGTFHPCKDFFFISK